MGSLRVVKTSTITFNNRIHAARILAENLTEYGDSNVVVLGIPRGGMIIAAEVARDLHADIDVVLTRKLGAPDNPELAMGAVTEDGRVFLNDSVVHFARARPEYIEQEKQRQLEKIYWRRDNYREILHRVPLKDRLVILTDDGIATGATMKAAIWAVKAEEPAAVIVAVPVAPEDSLRSLAREADRTICVCAPPVFYAIGQFYTTFAQVDDDTVLDILRTESERKAAHEHPDPRAGG